ncbi:hypothetical protein [Paenibacillus camerounensis]|uniref:hypothetical protein n=1 Tax=Paenibacillus camerounensis TaxID=1243663 RepID=UPI000ADDD2A5|nr:hypothetical protein [Paenibacillus camerounensis]
MLYSNDYITFNYEEAGEGQPILILHGNGPDHRMMMGCLDTIFRRYAAGGGDDD